ncbi:NAD(+) synthase [Mycoplasma todarodis]|uniref:NAD(+) synthase n=1 Tax=Mycoplasma todarodis TaxID=1937191 RepID=UPI003B2988E6
MKYSEYLVQWLQEEVKKANMDGVIVGLSGGVDSSVVAALAKKAFPKNSLGVYLPINNMGQDLIDAKELADTISIETKLVDLTESYEAMKKAVGTKTRLATANIKPRLRMSALYALAQEKRYLVLGTDNAAEWILGYFTKYGDGGVDLLPIVHLTKGEVKEMAKELKLPEVVWTKKPTAALWEGQTDEEELGFSYDEVDKYLKGEFVEEDILIKIKRQIAITNHKRVPLPEPKSKEEYK